MPQCVYSDVSIPKADGTYRLYRQFQSFSQLTHRITVRFRAATDKQLCKDVSDPSEAASRTAG